MESISPVGRRWCSVHMRAEESEGLCLGVAHVCTLSRLSRHTVHFSQKRKLTTQHRNYFPSSIRTAASTGAGGAAATHTHTHHSISFYHTHTRTTLRKGASEVTRRKTMSEKGHGRKRTRREALCPDGARLLQCRHDVCLKREGRILGRIPLAGLAIHEEELGEIPLHRVQQQARQGGLQPREQGVRARAVHLNLVEDGEAGALRARKLPDLLIGARLLAAKLIAGEGLLGSRENTSTA